MKFIKKANKLNKDNKGFSLIEVIVTLMIIAIISIPLIHSFVTSARINHKSRRLQNATDVAQNVAEVFQTQSMEYLKKAKEAGGLYGLTQDTETGNYAASFEQIGAEGEKFTVHVTMERNGSYYEIPELHNFFGDEEAVCIREITRYDVRALEELGLSEKNTSVYKSVDITVNTDSDGSYSYLAQVAYTYGSKTYRTEQMRLADGSIADSEGNLSEAFPVLYILYTPYNIASGVYTVMDNVTIHYNTDDTNSVKPVEVYFVPQTDESEALVVTYHYDNAITIEQNGINMYASAYRSEDTNGKFLYYFYDSMNSTLTQGSKIVYVYDVDISVSYGSDVLTRVSTIRQDTEPK